jgi:hypothetical protein
VPKPKLKVLWCISVEKDFVVCFFQSLWFPWRLKIQASVGFCSQILFLQTSDASSSLVVLHLSLHLCNGNNCELNMTWLKWFGVWHSLFCAWFICCSMLWNVQGVFEISSSAKALFPPLVRLICCKEICNPWLEQQALHVFNRLNSWLVLSQQALAYPSLSNSLKGEKESWGWQDT